MVFSAPPTASSPPRPPPAPITPTSPSTSLLKARPPFPTAAQRDATPPGSRSSCSRSSISPRPTTACRRAGTAVSANRLPSRRSHKIPLRRAWRRCRPSWTALIAVCGPRATTTLLMKAPTMTLTTHQTATTRIHAITNKSAHRDMMGWDTSSVLRSSILRVPNSTPSSLQWRGDFSLTPPWFVRIWTTRDCSCSSQGSPCDLALAHIWGFWVWHHNVICNKTYYGVRAFFETESFASLHLSSLRLLDTARNRLPVRIIPSRYRAGLDHIGGCGSHLESGVLALN